MPFQRFLRRIVAEHLQKNKESYRPFTLDNNIEDHIEKIKNYGEWGNSLDIHAISDALCWKIIMFKKDSGSNIIQTEFLPNNKEIEPIKTLWIVWSAEF